MVTYEALNGREQYAWDSARYNVVLKETVFDGIHFVCPTWGQMGQYTFNLAAQILDRPQRFDRIIALAKGGWTWARALADQVDVPELSSFGITSYYGINSAGEPQIIKPLTEPIVGENILLFDEVIDTGKQIEKTYKNLATLGPRSITVATLCYKPHSIIEPHFRAFDTTAWVVFPHEIKEFILDQTGQWYHNQGLPLDTIFDRFLEIGIPIQEVGLFAGVAARRINEYVFNGQKWKLPN